MSFHVLIAGGGIGGLCLAQGLRQAGVSVSVFERDAAAGSRLQGYRLRMDPEGDAALQECLPSCLFALYRATSNQPTPTAAAAYDHQLNEVFRMPPHAGSEDADKAPWEHVLVNRLTLRQVLLGGLDEVMHYGRALVAFEQDETPGRVRACFSDGSAATGDVLIGADGVHSMVRRQLLPHAEVIDTGRRGLSGKTPLTARILKQLPPPVFAGSTPILGPERRVLSLGMFRARRPPVQAAAEIAPAVRLDPVPDYLMWSLTAPRASFPGGDRALWEADLQTLHRLAKDMIQDWHPNLRRLVEEADVSSCYALPIRTSQPVPAWPTSRVTLLGDAIHAMTPAGGMGAAIALRDAALMTRQLTAVARGERDLVAALSEYEAQMRDYGFDAVERSLQASLHASQKLYRVAALAKAGWASA